MFRLNLKNLVIAFVLAGFLVAFVVLVWPTLYRYDNVTGKYSMIKINRINGDTYGLTGSGWKLLTDKKVFVNMTVEAPAPEAVPVADGFIDVSDKFKLHGSKK